MDINYEIHFHSYWHCSSGLSAGADIDTLVLKNADNLPYVPGRTMKGLVRDAINDICAFKADEAMSEAVCNVRACRPMSADWKKNVDADYKKRGK